MLQQRSTPFARRVERPRLAPPWAIAAIAALVAALLFLLFPQQALIRRIVSTPEQSELAAAYIANLLRTDPENPELRLVLARQQYRLGHLAAAEQTLRDAMAAARQPGREDAAWLLWRIRLREVERLDADSPHRPQAIAELRQELRRLAGETWSEMLSLDLARQALRLGELDLGQRLLRQLGERRSDLGPDWFEHAAGEALAQGQYRVAAELYFVARTRAATLAERRRTYAAGLRALQQGNLMADAVIAAERELKDLGDDRESLYLLVQIARAANRLDVADKYARRMLHMSFAPPRDFRLVHDGAWRLQRVAADDDATAAAFDEKVYRLGYEVFLNNGKPQDAYRVAVKAIQQVPHDLAWRQRLAQAAEWSGKAQDALDNWLFLARRSGRDEYWQHVLRLAPGLFDDDALVAALEHQLAKAPDNSTWQAALVDSYERLGKPNEALRYLQALQQRHPDPARWEAIAALAERNGDYATALASWRQRLQDSTPTPEQALRLATLSLQAGRIDDAARVLAQAQAGAADGEAAYWRLGAELAQRQQRDAEAVAAYRRLIAGGMGDASDYAAAVALLRDAEPLAAARIATTGWHRFHRVDLYRSALDLLAAAARWREYGELLGEVPLADHPELLRAADFLQARAAYYQQRGDARRARRDLQRMLALNPQSGAARQGLLWLAIDGDDAHFLRSLLAQHEGEWAADRALHDALAAAWLALSQPQQALDRYLTPRLSEHRGDFLWLMNYADALEQNGESERAWSMRRALSHAAARTPPTAAQFDAASAAARAMAQQRLALSRRVGDARLAVLRELVRLDRDGSGHPSPAAREAVLAWLQESREDEATRGYLWQQYGLHLVRPLWAEMSAALAEDDGEAIGDLLARGGERLSRHDRIAAWLHGGNVRAAQSDAFASAEAQYADDALQTQLRQTLNQFSDHAGARLVARAMGAFKEDEGGVDFELGIHPGLRLGVEWTRIRRHHLDDAALAQLPVKDEVAAVRLRLPQPDAETRITLARRDDLRVVNSAALLHEMHLDRRLMLRGNLGYRVGADESAALRVAGMQHDSGLNAEYAIGQRERLALRWHAARYFAQTGSRLGSGSAWEGQLTTALHSNTPDLEASVLAARYGFNRRSAVADDALQAMVPASSGLSVTELFIPATFRFYAARLSSNMRYQGAEGESTRIFRPYATLALTRHSEQGSGYEAAVGFAGSVLGGDRLTFGWTQSKGGSGPSGHSREVGLYYRYQY